MAFNSDTKRVLADSRRDLERMTDQQVRDLTSAWVSAWDILEPEYRASIEELLAASKDGRVTLSQVRANLRLQQALELSKAELDQLATFANTVAIQSLPEAISLGGTTGVAAISSQLPPGLTGVLVPWDRVSPDAITAMVSRATEQIHSRTKSLSAKAEAVMKQELMRGISVGASPATTASRILRRAEGGFNGGLTRAMTIARTETLDAHRAASQVSAKQNSSVLLKEWRWHCHLGGRTCGACLSMHGRTFPLDHVGPEGHQNCRCTRVDETVSWKSLGFNIEEPADDFPDARAWYDNLTDDSQAEILGKTRRDLLKSGEISWESLAQKKSTSGWRDSYVVAPLRDIT